MGFPIEIILLIFSIILIVLLTSKLNLHPFLALIVVALSYGLFAGMSLDLIVESINEGFGKTLGSIGLIIIFGVIIGAFLEETGGAMAIADKVIKWVGERRVPTAMGILGYIISIPVFADSGYILLSPLNKSLAKKAGISIVGSSIALALGLMASHTMIPPTPGPIVAAEFLDADLGMVILIGIPVSLIALTIAIIYAVKFAGKTYISPGKLIDSKIGTQQKQPSAIKASLPIIIPIILIVAASLVKAQGDSFVFPMKTVVIFLGTPLIALMIGVLLALLLPQKLTTDMLSIDGWVGKALMNSATILLITGAGGIFGTILRNSGIAETMGSTLESWPIGIWLPFIMSAAIKTAQGSSTVALITTASILAPMMSNLGFETGVEKALVVIAIGAGSAVVSHANDSFFNVVTQMSGMSVKQGYKLYTTGTLVLGLTAGFTVFILSLFL